MRPDQILIAFIVIAMFFLGMTLIYGELLDNYESPRTDRFNKTYQLMNDSLFDKNQLEDTSKKISENLQNNTPEAEARDTMLKGSFASMRLLYRVFPLANQMIDDASDTIGLSKQYDFLIKSVQLIILISIVFSIIYIITRIPY